MSPTTQEVSELSFVYASQTQCTSTCLCLICFLSWLVKAIAQRSHHKALKVEALWTCLLGIIRNILKVFGLIYYNLCCILEENKPNALVYFYFLLCLQLCLSKNPGFRFLFYLNFSGGLYLEIHCCCFAIEICALSA